MTQGLYFRSVRVRLDRLRRKYEGYLRPLLLAFLAAVLMVLPGKLTPLSHTVTTTCSYLTYLLRGPLNAPSSTAIIALNAEGKRELGIPSQRAWPRDVVAQVLENVSRARIRNLFAHWLRQNI